MPNIRSVSRQDHEQLRELLVESAALYPGIEKWCQEKVIPGLVSGARIGFVIDDEASLGGVVIAKRGKRAKLCAIRVREPLQDQGWGKKLLAAAMGKLCRAGTEHIYMTVSEALEDRHKEFFEYVGAVPCGRLRDKYVRGVDEFVYTWPGQEIAAFLARQMEGLRHRRTIQNAGDVGALPDMVMSLKPKFARLFLEGRKSIEFRRRFSRKYVGARVLFYVSSPDRAYTFTATVSGVERHPTDRLWVVHHREGGIEKEAFDAYFHGAETGYAVKMSDVRPLRQKLALTNALARCAALSPPQSYKTIGPSRALAAIWRDYLGEGTVDGRWHP